MLKRVILAVLLTLTALTTLAAYGGPKPQEPAPETMKFVVPEGWLELGRYPVITRKHVMTDAELQELGLQRAKLERPTLFYNNYRELGSDKKGGWRHEVLPAGTGVAVDKDGRAWYKLDCSNRLYAPVERDQMTPPAGGQSVERETDASPATSGQQGGPEGWSPWWWLWSPRLRPLLLMLLLAILGLLVWGIWRQTTKKDDNPDATNALTAWMREPEADDEGRASAAQPPVADPDPPRPEPAAEPAPNAFNTRMTTMEQNIAGIRETVAGIRETVAGLEGRVVTRLEPTVTAAVENGGKARAKAALAAHLARKLDEGNEEMVAALTEMMKALD